MDLNIYTTHKFLFTLQYEDSIKGHEVLFINRNGDEETIILEKIEIGASVVSCKLYSDKGVRYLVPFLKIRKIFKDGEMIWDATDTDLSNVKTIKGYD